jgi:predicted amidohydrolase YtcJ
MSEKTTFASIWATLSQVDVSGRIEKKQNLSFLSWSWAWGTLMEHYPQAEYSFQEPAESQRDGSVMVYCTVTIDGLSRQMWLPVMDFKNQAISNPDAVQVNKAKMRCLVKCLAMFGLGHYIYAGEDLPSAEADKAAEKIAKQNREDRRNQQTHAEMVPANDNNQFRRCRCRVSKYFRVKHISEMTQLRMPRSRYRSSILSRTR